MHSPLTWRPVSLSCKSYPQTRQAAFLAAIQVRFPSNTTTMPADPELDQLLLQHPRTSAIGTRLQEQIARRLWPPTTCNWKRHGPARALYFSYFLDEINIWAVSRQKVAIETYRDFLDLTQHLVLYRDNPRHSPEIQAFFPAVGPATSTQSNTGDIQLPLSQRYNNTTQVAIDNALELTIGLWLMLYMGPSDSSVFTGRSNFKWSSGFTLRQAIDNNFPRIPVPPSAISGKYRPELKAHNLERVGTIKIKWTRNLTDHLALDEEWGTLILYHFADFLRLLEGSSIER